MHAVLPALVALSLLLPASARSSPPVVKAPSRPDAVTVYRSGARVTRVARVDLPAGAARVVLDGLPDALDDDSIRVEGSGAGKARLFGVDVERVTGAATAAGDARVAEERLEALGDEERALQDRIVAAQARQRFVESLRSTYSEERAKNLAVRAVAAREWAGLAAFVEGELGRTAADIRRAEQARRELARRVAQARAELEKVQAKRGQTTKALAVEVEADRAGAYELRVTYAVADAGWRPVWDARLAPDTGALELGFRGAVWQRSGEDWGEVRLAVSTAQPGQGLRVPQLDPLWLTRREPVVAREAYLRRAGAPAAARPAVARPEEKARADAEEPEAAMDAPQAALEEGLLAATFTAPRRATVDGSGQARTVALARFPLQARVTRIAAPRAEPGAFLTAKAVNETGFPLLPGAAAVYVGDEYAGRAELAFTPAGGELELAFGQDERVEVERRVLERTHETAGLLSKDDVWRYRVRIVVKNRYAAPVALKLLDLVPVSRDGQITVEVLDGATAPTGEDPERPGVRAYELSLGPRAERIVELRYRVRFQRGFPVAGLE